MPQPYEEKSILVGIDFSPGAERALLEAVRLATLLHLTLRIVHVYEPLTACASDWAEARADIVGRMEQERRLQHEQAKELGARLVGNRVPYTVHVVDAMAVDGLLAAIAELKPELAVIGSHGRGTFKRMLLGSVSTALCHRSPIPVVVVPPAAHAFASEAAAS